MLIDLESLPGNPAELRAMNRLLAAEVKALTLKVEQLQHQLAGHNRHRFGTKSESLDQLQLCLAEEEAIGEAAAGNDTDHEQATEGPCRIIWNATSRFSHPVMIAANAAEA
jgi:hypothetical protein